MKVYVKGFKKCIDSFISVNKVLPFGMLAVFILRRKNRLRRTNRLEIQFDRQYKCDEKRDFFC